MFDRQQIIEMAREAGWAVPDDVHPDWLRRMELFANLAATAAVRREHVTQIVEDVRRWEERDRGDSKPAVIRTRSKK